MNSRHSSYTYKAGDLWLVLTKYGWQLPTAKRGWQTVRCGFHPDKTPSCRVSNDTGGITCFSCGFKGDVVKIVKEYEGCGWVEAYRRCEEITSGNGGEVRTGSGTGRSVPEGKRFHTRGGEYVPARLRER